MADKYVIRDPIYHIIAAFQPDSSDDEDGPVVKIKDSGVGSYGEREIRIDDDLPEITVDVSKLKPPPPNKKRTDTLDEGRWDNFAHDKKTEQLKMAEVRPNDVAHVRNVGVAEKWSERFLEEADKAVDNVFLVGADSESTSSTPDCTFQIAGLINGRPKMVVFQLVSVKGKSLRGKPGTNTPLPKKMLDLVRHPNVYFVGVQIQKDLQSFAKSIGISEKETAELKYVELRKVYHFLVNICRNRNSLLRWVLKSSDSFKSALGDVSLGLIYELAHEGLMMDKRKFHRNHLSDWSENRKCLTVGDLHYAAFDAESARSSLVKLTNEIGIRAKLFAQRVGYSNLEYLSPSLLRIVETFASVKEHSLTETEASEVRSLKKCEDTFLPRMVEIETRERITRAERAIAKAKLKEEREGKPFRLVKKAPSAGVLRLFSPSEEANTVVLRSPTPPPEDILPAPVEVLPPPPRKSLPELFPETEWEPMEVVVSVPRGEIEDLVDETRLRHTTEVLISEKSIRGRLGDSPISLNSSETAIRSTTTFSHKKGSKLKRSAPFPTPSSNPKRHTLLPLPPQLTSNKKRGNITVFSHHKSIDSHTDGTHREVLKYSGRAKTTTPKLRRSEEWKRRSAPPNLLTKVARTLANAKKDQVAAKLRKFAPLDAAQTEGEYISILQKLVEMKINKKRVFLVAKTMLLQFEDPAQLYSFLHLFLRRNVFGHGRVHAIVNLQCYDFDPLILCDHLFGDTRDGAALRVAIRNFPPKQIVDVAKKVAANAADLSPLVVEMKQLGFYPENVEIADLTSKCADDKIRSFIEIICSRAGEPIPSEARPFILQLQLKPTFAAFFRGEVEIPDFYQICIEMSKGSREDLKTCIELAAVKCRNLASFLAVRARIDCPTSPITAVTFLPICRSPINRRLHDFGLNEAVVIDSKARVRQFAGKLQETPFLAIAHHGVVVDRQSMTDLLSIRLQNMVFHFAPRLFADLLSGFVEALRAHIGEKTVFIHRKKIMPFFERNEWAPTTLVDVACVDDTLVDIDKITEATVGGEFCRRGSNFSNISLPSPIALQHRAIYVSLIYEYGAKRKGLNPSPTPPPPPPPSPRHRREERSRSGRDRDHSRENDRRGRGKERDRERSSYRR